MSSVLETLRERVGNVVGVPNVRRIKKKKKLGPVISITQKDAALSYSALNGNGDDGNEKFFAHGYILGARLHRDFDSDYVDASSAAFQPRRG